MVDEEGTPCLLLGTRWRGGVESSGGASELRSFGRERFRSVPVQDILGWIDRAREKDARVLLLLDCHRIPRLWSIAKFENDFAESVSRLSVPDSVVIVQSCSGGQHVIGGQDVVGIRADTDSHIRERVGSTTKKWNRRIGS